MGEILIMIIITIYYLHSNKLDKVDRMKDLGVTFDTELSFNFHCEDKINKGYSVLGLIKRNFTLQKIHLSHCIKV